MPTFRNKYGQMLSGSAVSGCQEQRRTEKIVSIHFLPGSWHCYPAKCDTQNLTLLDVSQIYSGEWGDKGI